MPKRLQKEEATATPTYAKFIADPFETGYGHTVGNSLRRVLLSSLEGAAITSLKVDGAMHEFTTIAGVVEDMTDKAINWIGQEKALAPDKNSDDAYVKTEMTLLESSRYPADTVRLKAEEWQGYQKRFPQMVEKKIPLGGVRDWNGVRTLSRSAWVPSKRSPG